jgi:copper chaperone CopZ
MKNLSFKMIATFMLFSININAQLSKVEIVATGLTCSMCSNAINKQLKKIAEIEKVDVDLNSNTFTISLKKENNITPKILKESIQKAGFSVGSMIITFANESLPSNYIVIDSEKSTKHKILDKEYLTMKEFKNMRKLYKDFSSYLIDNEEDYHIIAVK